MIFPSLFLVSRIKQGRSDYRFLYGLFAVSVILYLSLGVKLFRIFGFGTISLLLLWLSILPGEKDLLV